MKINEIVKINDEQTTTECLIVDSDCSISRYLQLYSDIMRVSKKFTIPSRKILPNDSLYEFVYEIKKDLASLKSIETRVPQIHKVLIELLDYFSG